MRGRCRVADRRRTIGTLLREVSAALPGMRDMRQLRRKFEDELRALLDVKDVDLRDGPLPSASTVPSMSVDVVAGAVPLGALDLTLDRPGGSLDPWDAQLLDDARCVAALVLLLERAYRAGTLAAVRSRFDGAAPIIGSSPAIRAVRERIDRVAATSFTVLIEGESGSGKELVARQIHDLSPRRNGPFVAVNCAAIVETLLEAELFGIEERIATGVRGRRGKFEHAHEGTLFLDEVADLSPAAQAKLLRAIQEMSIERVGAAGTRPVDVRIIAATNQKLSDLVARGRVRLDLFYRLHGVEISVPPLRERPVDILELTEYFLERHRSFRRLRLSQAAADALLAYAWPGNVRELQRVIERAVALADSDQLQLDDLPPALVDEYAENLMPSFQRRHTLRQWAARYVRLVVHRCGNNKRRACRELQISYHTLNAYLRRPPEEAGSPPAVTAGAGGAGSPQGRAPGAPILARGSQSGGVTW
ncbi:MAG TPA: sigma 54-interacting transcriptional regulator [Vicinamibacterales bacterium]|nr:sigma 54-interacting transcriptional regulator [Vicinamibacterales bacterium]